MKLYLFTDGEYSDYIVVALARAKEGLDPQAVLAEWRAELDERAARLGYGETWELEYNERNASAMVAWLEGRGLIEEVEYNEWHIGGWHIGG